MYFIPELDTEDIKYEDLFRVTILSFAVYNIGKAFLYSLCVAEQRDNSIRHILSLLPKQSTLR